MSGSQHRAVHYVRGKYRRKPWMRALSYESVTAQTMCTRENLIRHAYLRTTVLDDDGAPPTACGHAFRAAAAELAPLDEPSVRRACCTSIADHPALTGGHTTLSVF